MNKNKGAAMEAARQRKAKRLGERGSGIYPSIKKAVAILLGQTRYDLQSAAASAFAFDRQRLSIWALRSARM